jgi:hypothetical protein
MRDLRDAARVRDIEIEFFATSRTLDEGHGYLPHTRSHAQTPRRPGAVLASVSLLRSTAV